WNLLPYSTDWHSCRPGNTYSYRSLRSSWTSMTAIDPSPTAEATRLAEPERTSPAANTPGWLVSSSNGGGRAVQYRYDRRRMLRPGYEPGPVQGWGWASRRGEARRARLLRWPCMYLPF